jgi:hypothetical protein
MKANDNDDARVRVLLAAAENSLSPVAVLRKISMLLKRVEGMTCMLEQYPPTIYISNPILFAAKTPAFENNDCWSSVVHGSS